MKILQLAVIAVGLAGAGYAYSCPEHEMSDGKPAQIDVTEAAKLAKTGKVVMVDANGAKVRKDQGVVPGARLLSSYDKYDVKELKAQKNETLVFYCYNEQCGAAPAAAKLARAKGFNAKVMHEGIVGWKKAGQPVQSI